MSSSSPVKYTRKWYLNRLCTAIFGRVKIGYEVDKKLAWILPKSGFADKCDFKGHNSMAVYRTKMETLMYYTFLFDNTSFDLKYKDGDFSRDVAIQNALDFFKDPEGDSATTGIGINVHEYAIANYSDAKLLFIGLSRFVLSTIFEAQPDKEEDYSSENIQGSFRCQLSRFYNYLIQQDVFRSEYAKLSEEELYFDPLFCQHYIHEKGKPLKDQLRECYYAVPFTISELFSLPIIQPVIIRIAVGSSVSPELTKEQQFKRIVSGYIPLTSDTQEIARNSAIYCNLEIPYMPKYLEFSLSDIAPEYFKTDKKVYYITKIDISILESLYQNPQSHEELHRRILSKAKSNIKVQNPDYKHIEDDYASHIMDYIEDVISRFSALILLKEFIRSETPDERTGEEILCIFQIPYQDIFDAYFENTTSEEQWNVIYICLENAFSEFLHSIQDENLIKFIRAYSSPSTLNEHIHHCEKLMRSPDVDNAINLQQENAKKIQEISYVSFAGFEFKRVPDFVSGFRNKVEQYLNQLDQQ